jgi:hypothetical protein
VSSVDVAGRRRSPATFSDFHLGRSPANKGRRYPADPPRVEEIVAVMRAAGEGPAGDRMRELIVVLWRAGLRIQAALDLYERDLDPRRGALLVRSGKGGRRREVGMDDWAGNTSAPGPRSGLGCQPVRCSASSTARPAGGRGRRRVRARSCAGSPPRPGCGVGSRRTSCATPTPSRWRAREFR